MMATVEDKPAIMRWFREDPDATQIVASEHEIKEYMTYLHGRTTAHGDGTPMAGTTVLTCFGIPCVKANGEPWTHGEGHRLAGII